MLRPCGGFSDENVDEKAQVENLITNVLADGQN